MAKMYSNALEENIKFQFADYVNSVHEKLRVEKYISVMTNTQTAFVKKWHRFLKWHILVLLTNC